MMPGVLRFPAEISILRKECFNNWYKLRTYYLATLITSTPIHVRLNRVSLLSLVVVIAFIQFISFRQTLFAVVYATVVYFITEQPPEPGRYFKVMMIYVLVTIVADGFGILLGTLVNPIVSHDSGANNSQQNSHIYYNYRMEHSSLLSLHASCSSSQGS